MWLSRDCPARVLFWNTNKNDPRLRVRKTFDAVLKWNLRFQIPTACCVPGLTEHGTSSPIWCVSGNSVTAKLVWVKYSCGWNTRAGKLLSSRLRTTFLATCSSRRTCIKAGVNMKAVFWLGITFLTQISRWPFKQSRISMLISHIWCFGPVCKFFWWFLGIFGDK